MVELVREGVAMRELVKGGVRMTVQWLSSLYENVTVRTLKM